MFETEVLKKVVKEVLADVPQNKHVAFVTIANTQGIRFATAVKVNDEWDIMGYVQVNKSELPDDHKLKTEYGVQIQWTK